MASRGLWRLLSARKRRGLALSWSVLFVLSLLMQYFSFALASPVAAVHNDGLFELDRNAVQQTTHDWDQVYNDDKNSTSTAGADQVVFKTDAVNSTPDEHLFTGGGSKDGQDISSWKWTSGPGVQDKNDIEHAYAAAYTKADGHSIVYFGQDRYAQSGDAFVGFWFLKSGVSEKANGTFNGLHQDGDILVQVNFTNGGVISTFLVSKWEGGALVSVANGVDCSLGSTPANDFVCGVVNNTEINSPWPYTPKSGTANKIPSGGFFEAGIDLTHFELDKGCFSTFVSETRSSQSLTSTLSDYAMGGFSFCVGADISTQVKHDGTSTGSNGHITIGQSVTDTATLTGSKGTVTGTVDFFVCGPSGSAPDCSTGGTKVGATKTLSGGAATSDAFTPDAVGSYCFRVEYTPAQGSKYLPGTHTNSTTECFVVDKKNPAISTSAAETVNAGDQISDSATLSGATSDAGGTITFRAYGPADGNCSDTPAFTSSPVAVSGDGTYGPVSFTPATAGTYHWIASYSGDAKNTAVAGSCGDEGENDTVKKVNPSIATTASGDVTIGGSISDTATVSGGLNPSGTVSFALYGPNDADCSGSPVFTSNNRPLSAGTATSASFVPTAVGTYRWIATYNGDANNNVVAGACNDDNESVVVNPAHPSITTTLVSGAQSGSTISIALGDSAHDTSDLSNATADAGGTVHYQVFSDAQCQTKFADAGTKAVVAGVPGDSNAVQFNQSGNYYWSADYSGDAKNTAASSDCSLEVVSVGLNQPTISTNASDSVLVGGDIHDTATLAGGFNPTGTITFRLYGPNDASCATVVFTDTVDVDGNGDYSSAAFTTSAAGTYRWIATYSGDANNAAAAGACNDANESVIVTTPALHAVKLVKTNDGSFGPTSTANPGDVLTYQITVTNHGNGDALNVPISDDISAILAHATYNDDCNLGCSFGANTLSWTIPSIAANGGSVVLTFSVTLDSSFPTGTTHLPNAVVVVGPGSNCEAESNDPDCDTDTTVQAAPDLNVEKLVAVNDGDFNHGSLAQPGDTLNYKLTITNTGNAAATNVAVSDDIAPLLAHATYNDDCSNACSLVGSTLHWTIPSIAANGGSVTLTFSVKLDDTFPTGSTDLPNVVVVTGPGSNCAAGSDDADCATDNVVGTSMLVINKSFTGNTGGTDPDLNVPAAKIGDTLHYTLSYHGEGDLTNAVITDVLPEGLEYVDGSAQGDSHFTFDSYNATTRTLTWKSAVLLDPAQAETNSVDGAVTYDVKVLASAPEFAQPLVNTATIDSDQTEPDSDTAAVAVLAPPEALTPPPTDTFAPQTATGNPGFTLMLILLGVAGVALGIGFVTPVPETVRRRNQR